MRVEDRQASKKERSVLNPAEGGQPPFALVHLIIRSMATRPGSPVVVLGSGTGQEMLAAVRLGHPVYGFERSRVLVSAPGYSTLPLAVYTPMYSSGACLKPASLASR